MLFADNVIERLSRIESSLLPLFSLGSNLCSRRPPKLFLKEKQSGVSGDGPEVGIEHMLFPGNGICQSQARRRGKELLSENLLSDPS